MSDKITFNRTVPCSAINKNVYQDCQLVAGKTGTVYSEPIED